MSDDDIAKSYEKTLIWANRVFLAITLNVWKGMVTLVTYGKWWNCISEIFKGCFEGFTTWTWDGWNYFAKSLPRVGSSRTMADMVRNACLNVRLKQIQAPVADPQIIPSNFMTPKKPIPSNETLSLWRAQYHRHHVCIVPIWQHQLNVQILGKQKLHWKLETHLRDLLKGVFSPSIKTWRRQLKMTICSRCLS